MDIQPFGKIDLENLEEYYSSEVKIQDVIVKIDLNFDSKSIKKLDLEKVKKFIDDIETLTKTAFNAISYDYDLGEASETTRFYLQHHLEEFTEDEVYEVFGTKNIDKKTFFKTLLLKRIGFYPEDKTSYIIFDIQLPEKFTNYLLAVTFNHKGELSSISMES